MDVTYRDLYEQILDGASSVFLWGEDGGLNVSSEVAKRMLRVGARLSLRLYQHSDAYSVDLALKAEHLDPEGSDYFDLNSRGEGEWDPEDT